MREIKFRGKKKSDGNWIAGNYNLIESCTYIFNHDANGDNMNSPDDYEVIPETVGQFTGILDKDGNKIYEGDLFQVGYEKEVFECRFVDGCFLAYLNGNQFGIVSEIDNIYLKITGNIHENSQD
jgi:uncharacterized phage protein (TIGR01671 family)